MEKIIDSDIIKKIHNDTDSNFIMMDEIIQLKKIIKFLES